MTGQAIELRHAQRWLDEHPVVERSAEELAKRIGQVGQVKACAELLQEARRRG